MFKMIVVDDEYLVRLGIKETINWLDYDIEIIGEATNGKKGLELIKELKPDLIISDIKMPVMDGLELVKHINDINQNCRIIILSGYKDFEYAKDSLENGAFTYLLKPIDNDDLVKAVVTAKDDLKKEREKEKVINSLIEELPSIKHKFFLDILHGNITEKNRILDKINLYQISIPNNGYVIYGAMDEMNSNDCSIHDFFRILKETISTHDQNSFLGELFETYFVFLVPGNQSLQEVEKLCQNAIKQYEQDYDEILSIGVSNPYYQYTEISEAFQQAKQNAKNKLFPGINTVSTSLDINSKYRQQVIEAMDYITNHYHKNITVKMVADSLYVSESHLMHLFKEDVGKTFNECLTEYRIIIAKKMLLSGKYKIYEIAEKVGYSDVKYFSQIFRKKEGISPTDYINKENSEDV